MSKTILTLSKKDLFYESNREKFRYLIAQGIDGFRLNLAKFSESELYSIFNSVLDLINKNNLHNFIFVFDIPYPKRKARIVSLPNGRMALRKNDIIKLKSTKSSIDKSDCDIVFVDQNNIEIEIGKTIFFADGEGAFECVSINGGIIHLKALNDFSIYKGKSLSLGIINSNDNELLKNVCQELKTIVENYYFALSFVENEKEIKSFCHDINCDSQKILSKIETEKGIRNINEILRCSEGVILGRGDLYFYSNPNKFFSNCVNIVNQTIKLGKNFYLCTDILPSLLNGCIAKRSDLIDISFFKSCGCENFILSAGFSESCNIKHAIKIIEESEILL